jgi:outer membrane protein assembly factor BamB
MGMTGSADGRILDLGEETVTVPGEIAETIDLEDGVLVRYDAPEANEPDPGQDALRNIWKVGLDGSIRWRVPGAEMVGREFPNTGAWVDDGTIWAYNANGGAYRLDPETGDILDSYLMK